jgi:hypothetical protein
VKFGLIDQLLNGLKFMVIMIRVPIGKKSTLSLPLLVGIKEILICFPPSPMFLSHDVHGDGV